MYLVELVLLAELDALFPAVSCDPPELDQIVLLQALSQRDVVEVVVGIDGSTHGLKAGMFDTLLKLLTAREWSSRGERTMSRSFSNNGVSWVAHHGDDGVVVFLVLVVEEHQLPPEVLPHLLRFEFGVEDGELGEHPHVSALQPQGGLQHGAGAVGLAGSVHGRLVLPEVHQGGGQTAEVRDVVVEQFGCVIHLVIIATTYLLNVSVIWSVDELLELSLAVCFGQGEDQLRLNVRLAGLLTGHLQELHQIAKVPLTALCSSLSHLHVRRGVVSLDVRVDGFLHQALLKLGLRQLTPHRRLVAALRKLIGSVQLVADGDVGDVRGVVVVQAVDVLHHTSTVGFNGCFDCDGHLLWVLGLRQGRLHHLQQRGTFGVLSTYEQVYNMHRKTKGCKLCNGYNMNANSDLVDERSPVVVGLQQDARPQLSIFTTHQVAGQTLEQRATQARWGSLFSQYLPTTRLS
ncbi:hypothetical protein F7725_021011 [Dissostichus mawsoni]|uniref:Secreted protein n=1 Tax=Dissostichus mawsoni TaxID=36200 RepID=A0A7J5YFQ5_DISMA|nr:hypothetical protein F7725_021011 [Dissostichus mawsoni]